MDQWSNVCRQKAWPSVCAAGCESERERARNVSFPALQRVGKRGQGRTPQVRLEAVGVDDGDVGLDGEQGRARLGDVLGHVATAACEDLVDGRNAVLRGLDLDKVDRLRVG